MHLDPSALPGRSTPASARPTGTVCFAPAARIEGALSDLRARRFVCAAPPVPPIARGGLRAAIDEAVEIALAMRGAVPPRIEADAALGGAIQDQIFRARAIGAAGLAVALPALAPLAGASGVLDPADSATLAIWLAAAREGPVALIFADGDRDVRVLSPVPLAELAAGAARPAAEAAPRPAGVAPEGRGGTRDNGVPTTKAAGEAPSSAPALPPESGVRAPVTVAAELSVVGEPAQDEPGTPVTPAGEPGPPPRPAVMGIREAPAPAPQPARPPRRNRIVSAAEWRPLALELDEARGPKPVRAIEQLFMTHYTPLLGACLTGEADAAVHGIVDAWRVSFERSYREAFAAMRATGKRPPMVLDAPEIASRLARLNGARAVKLVLVDAMRFDLGERVAARLKEATAGRSALVERALLWAALPTTTAAQLALLSRGPDGLREAPLVEQEPAISRGRAVAMLRRERAGRCELMKLDLVEARLRTAGPQLDERLDAIADEVTEVLSRFMDALPPRTLVLVFGDHGFRVAALGDGSSTGPATQGGAAPEEVLVPAQAWLVGGVH